MARSYKLRAVPNGAKSIDGEKYLNFSLTVPPDIANAVPEGMEFQCFMDEHGIHYSPVAKDVPALPSWATGSSTVSAPSVPDAERPKRTQATA